MGRPAGFSLLLVLVLAADLVLRLGVALRPLPTIDGLTVPDDAYLSLGLARAIGRGEGPRNGLGHTNGFQPLYVFLMAPVYAILPRDVERPVHVALALLAAFDVLTLALLMWIVGSWGGSRFTPFVLAAAWIPNPYVAATSANGLETILAASLLVAALAGYSRRVVPAPAEASPRGPLLLGVLLGLAVLARIDSLLLAAAIGLDWTVRAFRVGPPARKAWLRGGLTAAGAAVAVVSPWLLYSYAYTRAFFPVSGRAVRFLSLDMVGHAPTFANFFGPLLTTALGQIRTRGGVFLILAALLAIVVFVRAPGRVGEVLRPVAGILRPAALFVLLLVAAYSFFIFTPWYFDRYLFPGTFVAILALAAFFDRAASVLPAAAGRALGGALVAGLLLANLSDGELLRLFRSTETQASGYRQVGLWARSQFRSGSVVGATQSGAIGYFADNLVVVNLDGVVNAPALEALQARRALAYVRSVGIEHVVGWRMNIAYLIRHSSDFQDGDLVKLGVIPELQSWGRDWVVFRVARDRQQ